MAIYNDWAALRMLGKREVLHQSLYHFTFPDTYAGLYRPNSGRLIHTQWLIAGVFCGQHKVRQEKAFLSWQLCLPLWWSCEEKQWWKEEVRPILWYNLKLVLFRSGDPHCTLISLSIIVHSYLKVTQLNTCSPWKSHKTHEYTTPLSQNATIAIGGFVCLKFAGTGWFHGMIFL